MTASVIMFTATTSCVRHATRGPAAALRPVLQPPRTTEAAAPNALEEAEGALRFDLERRSVTGEPIDASLYVRAQRQALRLPALSRTRGTARPPKSDTASATPLGPWEQLGPNNVAGRARTVLIDPRNPQTMYTAGPAGGIWKSTDAGQSWFALDDFLPILAIGSLAMDPQNSDILYAGTGDNSLGSLGVRGAGIYKSVDAGKTWNLLASTAEKSYDFRFVRSIVVSPGSSDRLYAATNKGVLRSADGGETWSVSLDRDIPNRGCQQLAIRTDRRDVDYLFASCGVPTVRISGTLLNKVEPAEDPNAPASIFLNADAASADKWDVVLADPNMGNSSIAIAPSNQNYVYVLASSMAEGPYKDGLLAVYRSTTGGIAGSFEARLRNTDAATRRLSTMILSNPAVQLCSNSPASQAWFVNTISVDPRNPERVFAASVDAFRSDDGGANWGQASLWDDDSSRAYVHADHHAIVFHPNYNGVDNQTVYVATDGGIFRTDNALQSLADTQNKVCTRTGIGIVWRPLNRNLTTTQFYHGAVYPGGDAFIGGLQDNGTQRGSAGGENFVRLLGGDGGVVAIDELDSNLIYGASQNFQFWRSGDGGATFTSARPGISESAGNFAFIAPMAVDPKESRRLWAGGQILWRTDNGATRWTAASGSIGGGSFSAITVSPHNSNVVFAGTRTGEIFRNAKALEADSSSEWQVSKPRTGWVSSILVDSSNPMVVYAVYSSFNRVEGDAHVYKSSDGGDTWTAVAEALPDAPYFSIAQHPEDPLTLFLAGDLGLFVSPDGGATWAREDMSFPALPTQHLSIVRDGSGAQLYAFTHGRGVWRVRLTGARENCPYSLSETGNVQMSPAGGLLTRTLQTAEGCRWSAFSNVPWLRVVSAPSGAGSTQLRLLVDSNDSLGGRAGNVTIAGQSFNVAQGPVPEIPPASVADEPSNAGLFTDLPFGAAFDNRAATAGGSDPVHTCTNSRDTRSVWFRYQASETRQVTANVLGYRFNVFGNPGTVLTAYADGNLGGAELGCAVNTSSTPSQSSISFAVTAGQSYLLQVSSPAVGGTIGYLVLSVTPASAGTDVMPASLDFGSVAVNETAERRLIVKNSGNQPLSVTLTMSNAQEFSLVQNLPATATIPIGGQREWVIRFTPRGQGRIEGTLQAGSIRVPLIGQGTEGGTK